MNEFDHEKYRKNVRKEKIESKKYKYFEHNEDERLQRKKISSLKHKKRQIEEDELWDEWKNHYK